MAIHSSTCRSLSLFTSLLIGVLLSNPALAAKKPKPNIIGPTGLVGLYEPSWPKVAIEIKVTFVDEGSPASKAGIKAGDVIVGLGSEKFKNHLIGDITEAFDVDRRRLAGKVLNTRFP